MFTSKTHGSIDLKQKIIKTIYVAIMGAVCLFSFVAMLQREVQAAPSSHLNFQARLLSGSGAIVPDGNYHVEFKLYDEVTGGTLLWTETRSTGNLVTVKNGYLSVYLGSVTAFPSTINWDNQLWLTMNIGGSGGAASWDGEMNPRIKLTAVPYAFQAGQLAKTSGANRGTLAFDTVANNPDLILPDESGTLCVQGSANCGFIQGSGTAFVQGGNDFGGTTAGALGTVNNGDLSIMTNNTTRLTVTGAGNVSVVNGLTVDTTTLVVDSSSDEVGIGTATPSNKLHVSGGSILVQGTHTGTSDISVTGSGTRMFFDVGKSAFRAGAASGSVWDGANNGAYSAAFGYNTAASTWGFAAGQSTSAAAQAVAFGAGTNASGVASAAFGWVTTAQAYGSMAIGQCNVAQGTTSSLVSIDTAFSIGNGTFSGTCSTNSNAFQVAYNGSTTINGGTLLVQGTHGGGVGNTVTGAGTRMFFDVNKSAFRTGAVTGTQWNDANVGNYSFAGGLDSTASGSYAFAYGQQTSAAGNHSTALGAYTRTGNPYAFAVGYDSGATGQASQTMGYGLEMQAFAATALGYCNYTGTGQSTNTWVAAEQLFAIGNGTYSGSDCTVRQNALEMTKNGNLAVDTNTLFVDAVNNRVGVGTAAPDSKLHVVDSSTSTTAGNLYGTNVEVTDTGNVSSGFDVTAAVRGSATRTGASGGNITSIGGYFSAVGDAGGSSIAYGTLGTGYGADTSIGVQGSGRFSGTVDTLIGVSGTADTFLAGGTATNAYGLRGGVLTANYAVTITNAAGLQVDSATKHASGTITNNYGIRVQNQTAGVSDYGLYIEGADTYALWVDSGATRLDGTLEVQSTSTFTGLTTLNGGLTVEAGDTFTFNGDAITDLTGTGLTLSTGALTVDNTVLDDTFFMQGGNSYGATAVLGTNDNNSLELETNGTTRLTINTSGDATLTGNLTVQGTGASSIAGTLAVTDHASFGADATIDGDITLFGAFLGDSTASSVVTIDENMTDFSNAMTNGQSINITANPSSAYSGFISGQLIGTQVGGSSSAAAAFSQGSLLNITDGVSVETVMGNFNSVTVDTTGDVSGAVLGEFNQVSVGDVTGGVYGSQNVVYVYDTAVATAGTYSIESYGDSADVRGLHVSNYIGSGTVTDQYGMTIALQSGAGSTITTAVGLDIADVAHLGTVTDSYALRVGVSSGAINNYGLAVEASGTQTLWISSNADNTTSAAGIAFGSSRDTNLYRSAANTLMTDDSLTVAGNLSVQGNTTLGNANTDTLTITGTAVTLPNNLNFDSDTLYIDATNNRIGIGDATPDFKLDVEGTSTAGGVGASEALSSITFTDNGNVTSGTESTVGLNVNVTRTGATGGTIITAGINATASGDTGGTSNAAGVQGIAYNADTNYGVTGQAWLVGSSNVTEIVGVYGSATQLFGGGATATNGFGLQGEVLMNGNTSVTNGAGLNIKSATASGGGAITNNYGVRIQNQTAGTNDYGLYIEGADTYALWVDSGATRLDGVTTIGTGLTTGVALTVNNGTSTGNILNLQDNGTNVFTVADGGSVGIKTGTNAPTADLTFGDGANRTINVLTRTSAGAGNNLTVVAGAANGSNNAGGVLTLQGGNAGTGNANGGNVVLTGGTGVGTGAVGLVVIGTPTFQAANVQNFTGNGTITAANVNGNGTVLISSNAAGYTVTLDDPITTTAGRVVYVTNTGAYDMTLSVNGGGTGNTVTLKPNTTATMLWNGADWTAAGASSSTDLQAAYDNTATSAGGAEIVLRSTADSPPGTGGLTIRNNASVPISGGLLEVQTSIGTNLFSVNNRGTELAANGGAETSGSFSTDWTAAPGGGTATRTTTAGQYVTGQAGAQVATTGTNHGIRNNLSGNPVVSTTYTVSFTAKASVAVTGNNLNVQYSRDGGTDLEACTAYSSQNLSTSVWTKITCTITTDGTTATNPDLIIRQGDATSRNIWIDNLSFIRNDSTTQPSNVQIGGGIDGGPVTLFTLDRATAPPVAAGDSTYYGSMYYDTTTGSIQCYEADGWGACGSPPDNIITLTPEYTGAVLNGSGVGTMTADFCGNGGGLSVNTTFCASGEARNYYRWTSPQASDQTYSIFVTYKLPSTFKSFLDDNTITLTAYKDHATNAEASLEVFRKNVSGGSISQCGSTTTITTGTSTWNTTSLGGTGETSCGFTSGDYVIFKINMMAKSNANVYVENLDFTFNNR